MIDNELELNISADDSDLYQDNKQSIDILHTLKVLAKLDTDKTISNLIEAHPSTAVSIALSVVENVNRVSNILQTSELSEVSKAVFTIQNIALASVVGMTLRAMAQDAELREQMLLLSNAMFEATNFKEETIH